MGIYDGLMPQQRAALGGAFAGLQGIGSLSGIGQGQQNYHFPNLSKKIDKATKQNKPVTLIEELQAETDEWIGDL